MTVGHRLTVRPCSVSLVLYFAEITETAVFQYPEDRNISLSVACAVHKILLLGDRDMARPDPVRGEAGELLRTFLRQEQRNDRSTLSRPLKCIEDPVSAFFQDGQICGG